MSLLKKISAILLAATVLVLSGCTAGNTEKKKATVAVSFYPVYIFTINLLDGIDDVEIVSVAEQNTGCLHDYTITAKDAKILNDACVLVVNGAGMEGFLEDLHSTQNELTVIDSSQGAQAICSEHHHHHEGDTADETQLHSHASINSHIWMSVKNVKIQVLNIKNGLLQSFPEYEDKINENYEIYISRLDLLEKEIYDSKADIKGKKVFAFHNAYEYMEDDFGFEIIETVETDEGGEPSARRLGELSRKAKEENISAVFIEPFYVGTAAEIIKRETGVNVYTLNPVTSGKKSKTAYEDIMRENIKVLKAVK